VGVGTSYGLCWNSPFCLSFGGASARSCFLTKQRVSAPSLPLFPLETTRPLFYSRFWILWNSFLDTVFSPPLPSPPFPCPKRNSTLIFHMLFVLSFRVCLLSCCSWCQPTGILPRVFPLSFASATGVCCPTNHPHLLLLAKLGSDFFLPLVSHSPFLFLLHKTILPRSWSSISDAPLSHRPLHSYSFGVRLSPFLTLYRPH